MIGVILILLCWHIFNVMLLTVETNRSVTVFALNFFTYLPESQIYKKKKYIFIQTNSFFIFTCPNLILLVPGFEQVG
jgi:hypothetical protein